MEPYWRQLQLENRELCFHSVYLFIDFGPTFAEQVARHYGHRDLEQLSKKLQYFALVDQIGTILDGKGRALKGQEDVAWRRLNQMIGNR